MRFQHGHGGELGVEGLEGGLAGAEEVFEEVGRDLGVQPEEAGLAVVDEVGAAFFDAGEGGPDAGRDDEVASFWVGEAVGVGEAVEGDDARVDEEGEFEGAHGFEHAHGVGAAVGRFVAGFEGAGFEEAEDVHSEFLEVFGEDELARGVGAGESSSVAGEDIDAFFYEGVADFFEGLLHHSCGSYG